MYRNILKLMLENTLKTNNGAMCLTKKIKL